MTSNVSAHGMDLSCATDLRPGTRCEVAFALPCNGRLHALRLQGCVVRNESRTDDVSIGVVFFGMPERTQELLELFVCTG
jgi:hypothetical protein